MEVYEIEALMENIWMKDKTSWEQTRTVAYVTAQCLGCKPSAESMTFPWEKQIEKHIDTREEKEAMYREMKEMEKKLNENNR